MKILALDTSSEYCSLALWLDGKILSRDTLAGQRHSELLLPMLEQLLAQAKLMLSDFDGIAFGAGPGSFTGLRIACGVAQGLAFGASLPVVGICNLEALAEAAQDERVIAAIDARMGEIYHGAYEKSKQGGWRLVKEPSLCLPAHAPQVPGSGWVGCGNGFAVYSEQLTRRYDGRLSRVVPELVPHAKEIVQLAALRFERGEGIDPALAGPLYIRNKVALKESER